jgi:two-component system chemotaxis response regulator CheB
MSKIRVLVVDDSVVVRRLVAQVLAEEPDIEVVGTAPSGRIALAKLPQVNPDVVTLDLEMPDMDGVETLAAIRRDYPTLPVLILSQFTQQGAPRSLHALALGASECLPLPEPGTGQAAALPPCTRQFPAGGCPPGISTRVTRNSLPTSVARAR